ncbi:unnamed protein product [Blepharisma stoltei]|uniref:Uncharacterized protein n=1 Tax=Blepharisma stoltei TaxID=1481888 RepID=A0AAU9I962_9CILI|nr:unnamed protein product [Blepharisma stoltei]
MHEEQAKLSWVLIFFMIYAPLALFEAYRFEISHCLDSLGFSSILNIEFISFLWYPWNWILNFLQYSSILYWFSYWITGFISLFQLSDYPYINAYHLLLSGIANSFFFILYNISARDFEYFILYTIMIGVFILIWVKLQNVYAIEKYKLLIVISTALMLKRIFYYENDISDIFYFCLSYFFYAAIIYFLTFYFSVSYKILYDYFENARQELQEKSKKTVRIEENIWKMCKIYIFVALIAYAMYLTHSLITSLWGEVRILKELFFMIFSGAAGNILVCSEDSNYILREGILNSFSFYCQIFISRRIIILIF